MIFRSRWRGFLWLWLFSLEAQAFEQVPLAVEVNAEAKGEIWALVSEEDILLGRDDFLRLGIRRLDSPMVLEGKDYVSLRALATRLEYKLDMTRSVLLLQVDPDLLEQTVVDFARRRQNQDLFGIDSAYLNYAVQRRFNESGSVDNLEAPLEMVIKSHEVIIHSGFNYFRDQTAGYWRRGYSRVVHDRPASMSRITVGDINASSGELGGGGVFGGISWQRQFAMAPDFNKSPGMGISGVLTTPSEVEVYVNDLMVHRKLLPPGRFEFRNLPNAYGAGAARMLIRDAFGRERVVEQDFYISSRLLKRGLQDFSYHLGRRRQGGHFTPPEYTGELTLLGFHRYGFSRALTAGMRFESSRSLFSGGPTVNFLLGNLGELEAAAFYSNHNHVSGGAGLLRYFYTSRYWHSRLGGRLIAPDYATSVTHYSGEVARREGEAVIGLHGLRWGAVSLGYTERRDFDRRHSDEWSLFYSVRLSRRASFLLRLSRSRTGLDTERSAFATINLVLPGRLSSNASHSARGERFTRSVFLQRAAPQGPGLGFRVRGTENERTLHTEERLTDASLELRGRYGVYLGRLSQSGTEDSYQHSLAGSVALVDDELFLSRPIRDSFALVRLGELDDVAVSLSNEEMGATRDGKLLVPGLVSYARNTLSLEASRIPLDYQIESTRLSLSPAYRSGGVAEFRLKRLQSFVGYAYFLGEQRRPAEYAALVLEGGGEVVETVVGRRGEFYLEDLTPGAYQATLQYKGRHCRFDLTVPAPDAVLVSLGEVGCAL